MKKIKFLLIATILTGVFYGFTLSNSIINPEKDKLLLEVLAYVLERGHYDPETIDDAFSESVFMNYIESMDGQHRFFIQADLNNFNQYKTKLDDQIKGSELDFFDYTHQKYIQRQDQIKAFYKPLLERPFDFSLDEEIDLDYEKMGYAESLSELKNVWIKYFKLSTLGIYSDNKEEELKKHKLDSTYVMLSDVDLEKQAREITRENMDVYFEVRNDLQRKDYFSIYLNAIATQFDPHTFYFAPQEKERFDTNISGKFEGIGARLQKKNQQIRIVEVISGGPVWRDKLLEVEDIIMKVAQENEEPVDISGMRIDDVVKLIKGPKGTKVYLTVKHVDATVEIIPITRDVVELEDAFAKSSIILKGEKKYGIIHLPKFYIDFKDYEQRNAASDVQKEIEKLKKENVEGIILDLRNNGGGSLQTVVDMTGFFIKDGPVVQVKSTGGKKQVLSDTDSSVSWDGPLVLMVNEFSASASEIIAAALQDYKRAVVIGSKQTFGKGTVQNVIDLNQIISKNTHGDLGALKLTTEKFYRINGGSTQLEGVKSDVVFPGRYTYIDTGEKAQDKPLSWDKISPASFQTWESTLNFDYALEQSKKRIASNSYMMLIDEQAKWIKSQQDENTYSLNYENFINERKNRIEETSKYDKLDEFKSPFKLETLKVDLPGLEKDTDLKESRLRWGKDLSKDIYLYEAVNVLEDLSHPIQKTNKLAQIKK
ncbi:MAG: carboxy terminal-processing peptidase [Flavobacteriaceae bacterium]|nr:carboxy terminal-processing peptidase [Flavobacteriaceae bacterium]MDO7582389.1 carboxy terminal-processing peptidase [Flavobacteriaceae bacterium]MDO7591632.1 carboxy terminal-processing peptidase [Flavobacteriaceae bacterium]MDO7703635.1 carboxy terminal-processing peptidase [Flavobacteriaceae bacterium]